MDFRFLHDKVAEEFSPTVAVLVVVALNINLVTKPKPTDLNTPGRFTERINKKTRKALWEHHPEDVELAIKIRDVWSEFENRITMDGLGGCQVKTLKQLLEVKQINP
jgi:hypothetical protein